MAVVCVILAFASLLLWWGLALDWTVGIRGMTRLAHWEPPGPPTESLSVIVPARNEAEALPISLATLLAQDLPALEIIVVDDRSDDGSAAVAVAAGAGDTRLTVARVHELPAGWLGKNHAMALGAGLATGTWLLFTDADVHFAPGSLRRALAYAQTRRLDHLALLPRFEARRSLLASFVTAFALLFTLHTRPWRAHMPGSTAAIGIGAFGLVRGSAYRSIGGHESVRMRVDDDLSLGRVLKHAGLRQEAVFGPELVSVEWYPDVPSALRGLQKNAFAGLDFSAWRVVLVVASLLVTNVLPFVMLPVTLLWGAFAVAPSWWAALLHAPSWWAALLHAPSWWAALVHAPWAAGYDGLLGWAAIGNGLVVLTVAFVYAASARRFGHRASLAAWHPVAVLLLCWATVASAVHALRSGEIEWRGTRYRLRDVRRFPR